MFRCHCRCCRIDLLRFVVGWCWNSKHIWSRGGLKPNNINFYATTKSWHAHQKIRLGESIWKEWVPEIFMEQLIELSTKPFQNPLLWHLFVLLESFDAVTVIVCCNRNWFLKNWTRYCKYFLIALRLWNSNQHVANIHNI